MSGWNELGAMLGGGDGVQRERLREAGMEAGVRQADLLEQARQRRDQSLGMNGVTAQSITNVVSGKSPVTGQPFDPDVLSTLRGELLSNMFHAKIDPRQLSGYQKDEQGIGWGDQAMAAATTPNADLNLLNRMNIVRNGKPVDLSTVQGDTLINRMVTPDQQAAYGGNTPTQIGLSDIALKGAEATAANARAGASNASAARQRAGIGADKAGNYEIQQTDHGLVRVNKLDPADVKPVTLGDMVLNKTGTGKSAASDPSSDAAVLAQARQRIQSGADPKAVAAYLASKGYPGVANKLLGNGATDGE